MKLFSLSHRMEYNTQAFSQSPFKIHEEFGLLIEDLCTNTPHPSRFRSKVPWRGRASKEYERRAMKFQSRQPNSEEHKITGELMKVLLCTLMNSPTCAVANGIFIQRDFSIRDEFREVVENIYKSEIQSLDFRGAPKHAAKVINE